MGCRVGLEGSNPRPHQLTTAAMCLWCRQRGGQPPAPAALRDAWHAPPPLPLVPPRSKPYHRTASRPVHGAKEGKLWPRTPEHTHARWLYVVMPLLLCPQDIEFTVQEGKLYMLQCRGGKRTGAAAVRIAVEMVAEGLVSEEGAVLMVEPTHLDQLLHPQVQCGTVMAVLFRTPWMTHRAGILYTAAAGCAGCVSHRLIAPASAPPGQPPIPV